MTLLLEIEEAAHELRIRRSKLYGLLASGALGSVKIGRRRLIPQEQLRAYVARLQEEARGGR
jgi:excisionase family DNA binding protein